MNIISRRSFLESCALSGAGLGLASITNIPMVLRRALAEGNIGLNGKKLIFIWMRGANDALNTVIPALDPSYSQQRPLIFQQRVGQTGPTDHAYTGEYNSAGFFNSMPGTFGGNKMFDATLYKDLASTARTSSDITYHYNYAIPTGNGFAALHSRAKWLAPIYNNGDLAIIHRVAYPQQSRSHFDSQRLWENGKPGDLTFKEGIFYRTMLEAIQASPTVAARALTGVSFQSTLPLMLQGSDVAMTNLSDPTRYSLLGVPNSANGAARTTNAVENAVGMRFPAKGPNRAVLDLQFETFTQTLKTFSQINFTDAGNNFFDDTATDSDVDWTNATGGVGFPTKPSGQGYWLFPHSNDTNGGWRRPDGAFQLTNSGTITANKYVLPTNQYGFMRNLKAAALVTLLTDATIAGTEIGGFDTHNGQVTSNTNVNDANTAATGRHSGQHADLTRTWSWGLYALMKFFKRYGKGGANEIPGAKIGWDDVVIITLSEFGRTSAGNTSNGTDHAEATCMFVAGGAVNGRIYCCGPSTETYNGKNIVWNPGTGTQGGTMFAASSRYLQRAVDYRSVLGELIRDHLGATQNQLNRIITGYATDARLISGGQYTGEGGNPMVAGELGII
jgi:uncharacterized protein (DUF1501 family)